MRSAFFAVIVGMSFSLLGAAGCSGVYMADTEAFSVASEQDASGMNISGSITASAPSSADFSWRCLFNPDLPECWNRH